MPVVQLIRPHEKAGVRHDDVPVPVVDREPGDRHAGTAVDEGVQR